MRPRNFPATLIGAVAAMCVATIAHADGKICERGFRDSTPAERARMTTILETVKGALPPAPAGWQVTGYEVISVPTTVCRDEETRPWSYGISRTYNRVDDYEARQKIMRDAAADTATELAERQPQIDALTAKMQALSTRQVALVQKGDMAGAQKINADMEKLQDEYKRVLEGSDSEARITAAGKESTRDQIMSISVRVNGMDQQVGSRAASLPPPAGATAAQRWTQAGDAANNAGDAATNDEGHALVLFGNWSRARTVPQWQGAPRANAVPTAAHVISVEVTGDPSRIDPMLQAINFPGLRAAFTK